MTAFNLLFRSYISEAHGLRSKTRSIVQLFLHSQLNKILKVRIHHYF